MLPKNWVDVTPKKSSNPGSAVRFEAIRPQKSVGEPQEDIHSKSSVSIKKSYLAGKNKYVNSVVELKRAYKNYKLTQDRKDNLLMLKNRQMYSQSVTAS